MPHPSSWATLSLRNSHSLQIIPLSSTSLLLTSEMRQDLQSYLLSALVLQALHDPTHFRDNKPHQSPAKCLWGHSPIALPAYWPLPMGHSIILPSAVPIATDATAFETALWSFSCPPLTGWQITLSLTYGSRQAPSLPSSPRLPSSVLMKHPPRMTISKLSRLSDLSLQIMPCAEVNPTSSSSWFRKDVSLEKQTSLSQCMSPMTL